MSTRYDDTLELGETWSLIVTCTASDGTSLTPSTADWKLKSWDNTTILSLANGSGIVIAGNVCTITVATNSQGPVVPGIYRHRLKVTDSGGAISRQIHGQIKVLAEVP